MRLRAVRPVLILISFLFVGIAAEAQDSPPPSTPDKPAAVQAPPVAPPGAPGTTAAGSERPKRIRIGGNVAQAKIVRMVQPKYPQIAKTAHVEGTLLLHAIIAKDGTIQELQYISGPALLMRSAMSAVRQWRYAPTLLAGEPVEVDTTISVVFTLEGASPTQGQDDQPKEIDPEFKADILRMLELTHFREHATALAQELSKSQRAVFVHSLPDTPNRDKILDSFFEKLAKTLTTPEAVEEIVGSYAKYFTDDDVKATTKFYETPAGQHYLEIYPKVYGESVQLGKRLGEAGTPEILKQLCVEYPELKDQARFCPADSEKISELEAPPASSPSTEGQKPASD